jgi:FtsH-binding integral membrane protein
MAEYDRRYATAVRSRAGTRVEGIDEGLRAFMLGIYNNMAMGLGITGLVAYGAFAWAMSNEAVFNALYRSPLRFVIIFAPLLFVFGLAAGVNRMQPSAARLVFLIYAAVMGLSLSTIFIVFTHESIARTFFITAASFGALSLWGYTTKKDISGWGSFLFMGLIGIILASIVNLVLGMFGMYSSGMQFAISVIGVLVFAGLTAYDTQRLKVTYDYVAGDVVAAGRASILGALSLYLDFINLFMFLLQFMGNNRN